MTKPIVILGIFVADTAYRAPRLPKLGETILGSSFVLGPGGKGSNQSVAAAMAAGGTRGVHFITRLGQDAFADIARATWARGGVTPQVILDDSYTGAAFIFLEEGTGQNAIIVSPGAAGRVSVEDVRAHSALITGAAVFVTQLEQPVAAAMEGLAIARAAGVRTILNPAPAAQLPDRVIALADLITPNESEAEALTGIPVTDPTSAQTAADQLLARGAGAVIVTLGANGALYRDRSQSFHIPAIKAGAVVDTTGAGDAFNGGLAVALAEGQGMQAAMRFATATAAISVTRPGTAPSMPARAEIEALLAKG